MNSVLPPPISMHRRRSLRFRQAVGYTQVDQARFLAAGNHFDRMAQRRFGGKQERVRGAQAAHRIGCNGAYPAGRQGAQTLTEAGQAGQRPIAALGIEAAVQAEACGHTHAVPQPVDDTQLAVLIARDHHVIAVGAQVDRGQQFAVLNGFLALGHGKPRGWIGRRNFATTRRRLRRGCPTC
ncbi:hypothetical protein PEC18_35750 [Paucibacter sp. O1-1]|nr:hypothetical protein [Paucibacter sp. O1-1]MDA3831014.1 hypothetical protein [Paucibacter sp. O1-1]